MEKVKQVNEKKSSNFLLNLLFAIPIVLGTILFISYCSATPNYQWIYDNVVVTQKDEINNNYYTIGDSHDCFTSNIIEDNNIYKTNSNSKELFKVNLEKLTSFNKDYQKLILDFSFTASIDSQNAVYSSTPKIDFIIDGEVFKTVAFTSESDVDYSVSEIYFKDSKELIISIKTFGITENSVIPLLEFKNLKIKVLGA